MTTSDKPKPRLTVKHIKRNKRNYKRFLSEVNSLLAEAEAEIERAKGLLPDGISL